MTFTDAIRYIRADEARKISRPGRTGTVQWFTTPDTLGFKDENGQEISSFSVADILAENWEIAA